MDLLAIYLQDHLALSHAGLRLARRCLGENHGTPLAVFLGRLVPELEEDRATLTEVARAMGSGPSPLKEAAAVLGELAGRLKLNGRVLGYSELSRVWELEALMAGTDARRGLWSLLGKLSRRSPTLQAFDFDRLEERARGHREELERERVRAAESAFRLPARRSARARSRAPASGG
jgi:hypothetical protein